MRNRHFFHSSYHKTITIIFDVKKKRKKLEINPLTKRPPFETIPQLYLIIQHESNLPFNAQFQSNQLWLQLKIARAMERPL